jgi:serine phosphatase RsbU (regulator of sigma subunit)
MEYGYSIQPSYRVNSSMLAKTSRPLDKTLPTGRSAKRLAEFAFQFRLSFANSQIQQFLLRYRWLMPFLFPLVTRLHHLTGFHVNDGQSFIEHITEWQLLTVDAFAILFSLFIWYSDSKALRYEKSLLLHKEILDKIPVDIAVFDKDHRYVYLNPEAIRNPELREWIIGKNDFEYFDYRGYDINIAKKRRERFEEAVDCRQQTQWVDTIKKPHIGETHVQRTFVPLYHDNNELEYVFGYGANVTELVRLRTRDEDMQANLRYANTIQQYLLPAISEVANSFGNAFVIWKPKDVVSGDFYWFRNVRGKRYVALADCTGHGVSGALLTVICMDALNRCVDEFRLTTPSEILTKAQQLLSASWSYDNDSMGMADGMDICLCSIEGNTLLYSSAKASLYVARDGYITTYRQNRVSIGGNLNGHRFVDERIELHNNDRIYMLSDGITDQFGGDEDKKFGKRRLKRTLEIVSCHEFKDQRKQFLQAFEGWKGLREQVDDKTFLGIEFHT